MMHYLCFQMTDEILQTEHWGNRERRSLFLRVPFESPHLHQPSLSEAELRMAGHSFLQKFYVLAAQNHAPYGKIWA